MIDIRYMSKAELDELNRQAALWRARENGKPVPQADAEQPSDAVAATTAQPKHQLELF